MESLTRPLAPIVLSLALLCGSQPAHGFTILTFVSDACHENITLGALGIGKAPFSAEPSAEVTQLYNLYLEDIRQRGVPEDRATRAFVKDVARLYDLESRSFEEQYLLASFVCGVRLPDTQGLAIVRINDARFTHLADENQSSHSLRHDNHKHSEGNSAAIERIRESIVDDLQRSKDLYQSEDGPFF